MIHPAVAVDGEPREGPYGNYFVSAYPPFSCWTAAATEQFATTLAQPAAPVPLGLYVHVPFCIRRCRYCYYLAYAGESDARVDRYVDALGREATLYAAARAVRGRPLRFVYFGGGTPSLLEAASLRRLFDRLRGLFDWGDVEEVTFECAPASVTRDKLEVLRAAGVTRLSLGVQQLDDDVLHRSGRVHTVAQVERAFELVRTAGFDVVNLDLMVGMVGESDASFVASLQRVIEWAPESVTLYQLEMPLNTPLYRAIRSGQQPEPASWETKRRRLGWAFGHLESAGYSVRSAYGAVRDRRRDRFVYQEEQYRGADLIGLGASAFSYLNGVHQQNLATLDAYLEATDRGALPLGRAHVLSPEERLVRELVLQLKLGHADGGWFRQRHGVLPAHRFAEQLRRHVAAGWVHDDDDGGVRLTRAGLLRADRLVRDLFLPEHRAVRYS